MVEFLKKLGVPAMIAAMLGALLTIIPIMFKLDERYAKEQQLTQEVVRLEGQINDLSIEVGKLAGSTQVLVSVMSAKQEVQKVIYKPVQPMAVPKTETAPSEPIRAMLAPPDVIVKPLVKSAPSQQLIDITKSLETTQQRIQEIRQSQTKK
jgi:hypothetical protein